jgi:hypothetical protein
MIFWFETTGNDCSYNRTIRWITPYRSSSKNGFYIEANNFRNGLTMFVCKSEDIISQSNWIFHHDVYLAPKMSLK